MNVDNVLGGIGASDRIEQGQFFRLTFAPTYFLFGSQFAANISGAYDALDAADGLAQPVSVLAVTPGQYAAVFDVIPRPAAFGLTAADFANYLDDLRFGLSLTSMTLVDSAAVLNGASERDDLQSQLDAAAKAKNPLAILGDYAGYFKWILILALVVALLYFGEKAVRAARSAA